MVRPGAEEPSTEQLGFDAMHEASNDPILAATWLRGFLPLQFPDPLSIECSYTTTYSGMLDVQGTVF